MKLCPAIKKTLLTGRNYSFLFLIIFSSHNLTAQETNSRASGKVFSDSNETVIGVTVTIIHEPTQNKYIDVTRNDGYFNFCPRTKLGIFSVGLRGLFKLCHSKYYRHDDWRQFCFGGRGFFEFYFFDKGSSHIPAVWSAPGKDKSFFVQIKSIKGEIIKGTT